MLQILRFNRSFKLFPSNFATMSSTDVTAKFFNAISMGDLQTVDDMLKNKQVDISIRNPVDKNNTALHAAAYEGKFHIVKSLVDSHHADVNSLNDAGKLPIEGAVDKYHGSIARYLIRKDSEKKEYADKLRNPPEVEELIEAAENNNLDKVKQILDAKTVSVDAKDKFDSNRTLLHIAAKYGYVELARVLVEYGADTEETDDVGDRPVDLAVAYGIHEDVADYLMELDGDEAKNQL